MLAALLAAMSLSSCGALGVPSGLALDGRTLSWSEARNASSYLVLIDGEDVHDTPTNSFVLPDNYFGELTFNVAAVANGVVSEYSLPLIEDVFLTLPSPSNLRQDGGKVRWDEVDYASGYAVRIGGVEHIVAEEEYSIQSSAPVQVAVLASGSEDGYVVTSAYSDDIWFRVALQTPTGIAWSDGILSWNAVDNATSYQVVIDDDESLTSTAPQCDVGFDHVGSVNFKVKAMTTDERYFDSEFAEKTIQISPLTLAAPQNVFVSGGILHFDLVPHAQTYLIYGNGEPLAEIEVNYYTIPDDLLSESGAYLQVQALSTIHNDSPLSEKAYLGAIEIDSEEELRSMEANGYYVLVGDIALSLPWTSEDFGGIFDGGGHIISGLSIEGAISDDCGFFKSAEDATISNLALSGHISVTSAVEGVSVGGLVGASSATSCDNVSVDVDISFASTNGIASVGGAFGRIDGGEFSDVTYQGDITAQNAISGGFVGKIASSTSAVTSLVRCGSQGTLSLAGGEQSYAGGFVGLMANNSASISSSRALVDVEGTSYVGGFVAYMGLGSIDNAYARGSLTASSAILVHAGGFVGRVEGYNNAISYSIAMMTIDISSEGSTIYVGSFAGVTMGGTYANIYQHCYYDSTLSSHDRIGNDATGRGDGITGLSSANLLLLSDFNVDTWDFTHSSPWLDWEI